ncbi:uncharacterized protein AB675_7981 [Cyphellophora attinorum]|uniref:DOMON domain-containing protein n=1 Tax=Cyphellophora attinorum TaxID=1664694 RepID=A0A0N0NN43_9EURO|nr:uncharacterized protein AB675_7981 [Phialophora attinorum]KPI41181.1 hypothetical protein AB675_7981 [Phialophora attinorum]
MYLNKLWPSALLATLAKAQFASYSEGSYALSVNVPSDTASGSGETIYLQISAPSDTSWVGFGYGSSQMRGSSMLVVYADGNNNVTVSPRTGTGHVEPNVDSSARITVLDGSRVNSDGSLVANIRCDSCIGSSLSATATDSTWIWAYAGGSALDSTDTSANIQQHSSQGGFNLDLTKGTGGSSSNPFVAAAVTEPSASASASAPGESGSPSASASASGGSSPTPSATNPDAIAPVASQGADSGANTGASNNGSSRSSSDPTLSLRKSHGILMSITFVVLFPLAALTMYLPFARRVLFVHAPLQVIGIILMIAGLATGVLLGNKTELDEYHQIIGYIVVALLVLFQPILGLLQHLYFRRHGGRSIKGVVHQWLGRSAILLGIINGGLGFNITGPVGSTYVPKGAVIAYGVIAGLVGIIYIAVVVLAGRRRSGSGASSPRGEKSAARYNETELQPRPSHHQQQQYWEPQGQAHGTPGRRGSQRYTIEGR